MFLKIKKNNQGTALILTILIAGVLFALSSFLISKVLMNTKMVEKTVNDEKNYNLAKLGILYALHQLNSSEGTYSNYNPTDWPGNTNWKKYEIDSTHSGDDVRLRVTKNTPLGYITIESQSLPKKQVSLKAVVYSSSQNPLTEYVRLIGSSATFEDNTFDILESTALIQGNAPFCILGDLTWKDTNNLILDTTTGNNTVIYGDISLSGTLNINSGSSNPGFYYYTPTKITSFDTAEGHYFDRAHLPCCYDHSNESGTPIFYYGNPSSLFWPEINEVRYSNLVGGEGSNYYISGISSDESDEWYNCSLSVDGWEKIYEDSPTLFYTGTGTLITLDGNGQSSGTPGQVGIDDGGTEGEATAGDDIIEGSEWRSYPSNGLIYSPGNIRILGIIDSDTTPRNLTIVSGGTIYIEGNIIKEKDSSSLALLAKDWIALNPTHKFTGGYFWGTLACEASGEEEDVRWKFKDNLIGEDDNHQAMYQVGGGGLETLMVFDFERTMTFNTVTFIKLHLNDHWLLSVWGSGNSDFSTDGDIQIGDDLTTPILEEDIDFISDEAMTYRFIKIYLVDQRESPGEGWASPFQVDAIKISLGGEGGDGTYNGKPLVNSVFYAQKESWAVIPGNGDPYPIVIGGCIAENKQEKTIKWSDWSGITYRYDSNLLSNPPPHLPPSVNIVSLKRD